MGMGIGVNCERCGEQLSYDSMPFESKEMGDNYNICGDCVREKKKQDFDKENNW